MLYDARDEGIFLLILLYKFLPPMIPLHSLIVQIQMHIVFSIAAVSLLLRQYQGFLGDWRLERVQRFVLWRHFSVQLGRLIVRCLQLFMLWTFKCHIHLGYFFTPLQQNLLRLTRNFRLKCNPFHFLNCQFLLIFLSQFL